ncbi:hypothetical protein BDU57DRAFT_508981 [Ampelomyces quisqualis]|uniref:Uncharacterized protein n=1 Tax=Ampelomyces quisqualis TaxID=50730 RepID=A0A6A5R3R4_AMPQU|nr:hypothetical protein BDU57DRAFT_508981 [Ampelomyces quisqualis]
MVVEAKVPLKREVLYIILPMSTFGVLCFCLSKARQDMEMENAIREGVDESTAGSMEYVLHLMWSGSIGVDSNSHADNLRPFGLVRVCYEYSCTREEEVQGETASSEDQTISSEGITMSLT